MTTGGNAPHELNEQDAKHIQGLAHELDKIVDELTTFRMSSSQVLSMGPTIEAVRSGLKAIRGRCDLIIGRSAAFARALDRIEREGGARGGA